MHGFVGPGQTCRCRSTCVIVRESFKVQVRRGGNAERKPQKSRRHPVDSNPDVIRARDHLAVAQATLTSSLRNVFPLVIVAIASWGG